MNDVTQIIYDFIHECKADPPHLDGDGEIFSIYDRNSFEDLWGTIGDLYKVFTLNHIPTKCLTIDIDDVDVTVTLTYDGLRVLLSVYPSEDEEGYAEG